MTDRRASCLLCAGRCDPGRWTCRECHRRVISAVLAELVDEATAMPVVGGEKVAGATNGIAP